MPLVYAHIRKAKRPKKTRGELLAESYEGDFRRTFTTAIDGVLSDAQIKRLARAVRDQDLVSAMQMIPPTADKNGAWQKARGRFEENYAALIDASGQQSLGEMELDFTFDVDQRHIVQWIDAKAGALIADIAQDTRDSIKDVIRQGSFNGLTLEQQARLIRPMIGLTDNATAAVARRYASMVDAGMDEAKASAKAETYAGELLAQRADLIARTETITAQNYGKLQSFHQARAEGLLGDHPTKTWVGSEFESSPHGACEFCAALNGVTIPLDEMFDGGDFDDVAAPPLHPACRCGLALDSGFGGDT